MSPKAPMGQLAGRPSEAEPSLAELLDPIALESRLAEARARRAEALARRAGGAPPADPAPAAPAPRPAPTPLPAAPLPEPVAAPFRVPNPSRRLPLLQMGLFLGGLGLGAAAVLLSPQGARDRITALIAPAEAPPEAPPPVTAPAVTASAAPAPTSTDPVTTASAPPPAPTAPAAEALPEPEDPPPLPPPPTAAPAEPNPTAATEPAPPDWSATARVYVHFPPDARAAAEAAADALRVAGVAEVAIAPAGISVDATNVRFYHAADAAAAQGVAGILAAAGDAPPARDFTDFAPPPRPGMVEVWLAGEAPARATPARLPATAPRPAAAPDIAEEVARILVLRALEQIDDDRP